MKTPMTNTTLSQQQLKQFQDEGFLILPAAFAADEIARMRREADAILDLIINSSIALNRPSRRMDWLKRQDGVPLVRKIQPINDLSDYLASVSADERLIGPMREIMGDEPVLMEEKLNYKQPVPGVEGIPFPAKTSDRFPIHNDWAYYSEQKYPQDIISSAVSLDECTAANGPLRVWPGSHKHHREHELIPNEGLQVKAGLIDFNGGQDVLAPPGTVMLFHSLLVHNSRSNDTMAPRRLMIYSHFPKRFNMGHDVRNGPGRRAEQPHEEKYRQMLARGEYAKRFTPPAA
jgi:ectoine hydroxylase-related dioxygenase (phytanoyl-CoA dioxygenase family)